MSLQDRMKAVELAAHIGLKPFRNKVVQFIKRYSSHAKRVVQHSLVIGAAGVGKVQDYYSFGYSHM